MLKPQFIVGIILLFTSHILFAQENTAIEITDKLIIEFGDGHECMTQTRAASKEEALYNTFTEGPVKYVLSKKGALFSVYRRTTKGKWDLVNRYPVSQSFMDKSADVVRYNFFMADGSVISYLPKIETGKLVILDIATEDVCYFVFD